MALEKPLGSDLESSREINDAVAAAFPEERIFRIDHYLGKETVQNLLALRFAQHAVRAALEQRAHRPCPDHGRRDCRRRGPRRLLRWRRRAARHGAEPHAAAARAGGDGAARPTSTPTAVRDEKVKVLRSLRPITAADDATCTRHRPVHARRDRRRAGAGLCRGDRPRELRPRPSSR